MREGLVHVFVASDDQFQFWLVAIVRNFADENQTITIIDPNTGRKE